MALTGIQIYKLLPQTNCKECGFPTCLAFAMKLAAKQVELSACPYVSEEAKAQLEESAAPPIRLITLKSNGYEVKAGNEVVMFRHEKTFYNKPGLFVKLQSSALEEEVKSLAKRIHDYCVNYVGIELQVDGFAVEDDTHQPDKLKATLAAIRSVSNKPVMIFSDYPENLGPALEQLDNEVPLIGCATSDNWEKFADLAKRFKAALAVKADQIETLAELTEKIKGKGVEDLVLVPMGKNLGHELMLQTQLRRLALKANYRPVGYPTLAFCSSQAQMVQAIAKYAGFLVLDAFAEDLLYPLLVLRQNIYTDPQKPIQVQPGLYEINNPQPTDPVLVTTNFSITYFSVANEVESSGYPAHLLVTDAEGMSVLTAWAAGKFDAERIAKAVRAANLEEKITRKRLVLPGAVAVLSGEVEAELPGWEVRVGPREAVDIPKFYKQVLQVN
ncbi:MAG: acetyl-CoA decarbonylase/synthase complex subunit gamma [Anaerolineales bacterium]|nr:acetyl-CoA decarbonylase/synthase complex subunit gamma [Anaerolineales bacterium]MCS7247065.1 acetyl-CoA decarbonylase/synthase complex subunit gamma [Anaerolineales bacterium]MDW8160876.1 acetyl-CoA decarbonylase/synthase complex subunit gamma [Anaerolineales bacterium]MDW8446964.1 acetyl-CoA decarbonylase/synthase complex subunit gamma [Anaerolineales bacterium]